MQKDISINNILKKEQELWNRFASVFIAIAIQKVFTLMRIESGYGFPKIELTTPETSR